MITIRDIYDDDTIRIPYVSMAELIDLRPKCIKIQKRNRDIEITMPFIGPWAVEHQIDLIIRRNPVYLKKQNEFIWMYTIDELKENDFEIKETHTENRWRKTYSNPKFERYDSEVAPYVPNQMFRLMEKTKKQEFYATKEMFEEEYESEFRTILFNCDKVIAIDEEKKSITG